MSDCKHEAWDQEASGSRICVDCHAGLSRILPSAPPAPAWPVVIETSGWEVPSESDGKALALGARRKWEQVMDATLQVALKAQAILVAAMPFGASDDYVKAPGAQEAYDAVLTCGPGWAQGEEVQSEYPVGPAECELRPVYRREGEGQPYQALLVVRVAGREVVVRLAPEDVARMHAALSGEVAP